MNAPERGTANEAMRVIVAAPLTREAFAAYGELLAPGEQGREINFGTTRRFDDVAPLDVEEDGGRAAVAIFRTDAHTHRAPYPLRAFERHLLGSQSFVPLGAGRCLAVLAGAGAAPDEEGIAAFIIEPGQGITLRRGVWHHPLITIGAADVLVIERQAREEDCEVVALRGRAEVRLP
ncbi:ureidoglycolate lyase [Herbaspirillum sp. WKF16]|jgi:ureidoglycolate lyase|uniref:ureidoglycolate lyase n=1 Tax=Herbaspirillum sp. WKF16 TaxID=3028312 RepID=UPI0023A9C070|nr:ureidoglycolate lyase [Herbaspirillum sp. WKF16]WDZ96081.1 ureidoglycolate lyase [Herbaspirillum sp. WKF16]